MSRHDAVAAEAAQAPRGRKLETRGGRKLETRGDRKLEARGGRKLGTLVRGAPMSADERARSAVATAVSATGVVYGDIGTSPLYAFDLSLKAAGSHTSAAILGVVSLIFWALAISVTLKYVIVMMRA